MQCNEAESKGKPMDLLERRQGYRRREDSMSTRADGLSGNRCVSRVFGDIGRVASAIRCRRGSAAKGDRPAIVLTIVRVHCKNGRVAAFSTYTRTKRGSPISIMPWNLVAEDLLVTAQLHPLSHLDGLVLKPDISLNNHATT